MVSHPLIRTERINRRQALAPFAFQRWQEDGTEEERWGDMAERQKVKKKKVKSYPRGQL